jgi:hypothetical protein
MSKRIRFDAEDYRDGEGAEKRSKNGKDEDCD